ncbi:hypothetical protein HN011_001149 [Eciton burchellii]|nr:hypothetical protein HN011_001149 [Eciton burchellii]
MARATRARGGAITQRRRVTQGARPILISPCPASVSPDIPRFLISPGMCLDASTRDSRDEKTRNDKNRKDRARERDESREITRCRNCAAPFIRAKLEKRRWILGLPSRTFPSEILTVPFIKMQR